MFHQVEAVRLLGKHLATATWRRPPLDSCITMPFLNWATVMFRSQRHFTPASFRELGQYLAVLPVYSFSPSSPSQCSIFGTKTIFIPPSKNETAYSRNTSFFYFRHRALFALILSIWHLFYPFASHFLFFIVSPFFTSHPKVTSAEITPPPEGIFSLPPHAFFSLHFRFSSPTQFSVFTFPAPLPPLRNIRL